MLLLHFFWYFAIYSLIGFLFESTYLLIKNKKFTETGFLKGPFCPLYGSCAVVMIFLLLPLQQNIIYFYLLAVLITSILEYITATILELIFHIKFWDYSDFKINLQGRIALPVSLTWGLLSVVFIKFVHPLIVPLIQHLSFQTLFFGTVVFSIYLIIDTIYTSISLLGLKKVLKTLKNLPPDFEKMHRRQIRFFKSFPHLHLSDIFK
jgi:uncharacterized membrane protein